MKAVGSLWPAWRPSAPWIGRPRLFRLACLAGRSGMNILGISAYYHDSAAALVRDGDIVAAAQEEDVELSEVVVSPIKIVMSSHRLLRQMQLRSVREPASHGPSDQLPYKRMGQLGFDSAGAPPHRQQRLPKHQHVRRIQPPPPST